MPGGPPGEPNGTPLPGFMTMAAQKGMGKGFAPGPPPGFQPPGKGGEEPPASGAGPLPEPKPMSQLDTAQSLLNSASQAEESAANRKEAATSTAASIANQIK